MSKESTPAGAVHMVVAHAAEARPLIDHFKLQPLSEPGPFRVYAREGLSLVISNMGKVSSATAVAHLAGRVHDAAAWLNVGVAGHRSHVIGSTHIVNKVVDHATRECWYPQRTFSAPCRASELTTVDRPETGYAEDTLYDMEGAGFCVAATRYSTLELVQLIKVVSDNAEHPISTFDPKRARNLIGEAVDIVARVIGELGSLAANVAAWRAEPPCWDTFIDRWHFTVSQRVQLRRLLQRWSLLKLDAGPLDAVHACRSAREVLGELRRRLETQHPQLGIAPVETSSTVERA